MYYISLFDFEVYNLVILPVPVCLSKIKPVFSDLEPSGHSVHVHEEEPGWQWPWHWDRGAQEEGREGQSKEGDSPCHPKPYDARPGDARDRGDTNGTEPGTHGYVVVIGTRNQQTLHPSFCTRSNTLYEHIGHLLTVLSIILIFIIWLFL